MKVLVATTEGQGLRSNDFSFTVDAELVHRPFECGNTTSYTEAVIDDNCGCHRAMGGLASSRATTTFAVADLPIGRDDLIGALADYYRRSWDIDMDQPDLREEADELLDIADRFDVGTVLERRGDDYAAR